MAKELSIIPEFDAGLYDSETDKSCVTEKVVEVTDDCPSLDEGERFLLLFTRSERGRIVVMKRPYPGKVFMGTTIHFFVDELDAEMNVEPGNDTFGSWANRVGLSKPALQALIKTHAPAHSQAAA